MKTHERDMSTSLQLNDNVSGIRRHLDVQHGQVHVKDGHRQSIRHVPDVQAAVSRP